MICDVHWSVMGASVKGTSHIASGKLCQDYFMYETIQNENNRVFIAVMSDGAGSAQYAEEASKAACKTTIRWLKKKLLNMSSKCLFNYLQKSKELPVIIRDRFHKIVQWKRKKNIECRGLREFACTLLVSEIEDEFAFFLQIGDGVIVVSDSENCNDVIWMFWPQKGEYENTTVFITDAHSEDTMQLESVEKKITRIGMLTDGLQHLALQYDSQEVYAPFFTPLFNYLISNNATTSDSANKALRIFLNSKRINERTDDDKTLLCAVRIQ